MDWHYYRHEVGLWVVVAAEEIRHWSGSHLEGIRKNWGDFAALSCWARPTAIPRPSLAVLWLDHPQTEKNSTVTKLHRSLCSTPNSRTSKKSQKQSWGRTSICWRRTRINARRYWKSSIAATRKKTSPSATVHPDLNIDKLLRETEQERNDIIK